LINSFNNTREKSILLREGIKKFQDTMNVAGAKATVKDYQQLPEGAQYQRNKEGKLAETFRETGILTSAVMNCTLKL
jgi:hypothetical protein